MAIVSDVHRQIIFADTNFFGVPIVEIEPRVFMSGDYSLACLNHDSVPMCKESTLFFICWRKVAGMNTLRSIILNKLKNSTGADALGNILLVAASF